MASAARKNEFGLTVAKKREQLGWSQEELAFQSRISRNSIQSIESGNSVPKADKVNPLCAALGCTPNELFGYEPDSLADLTPELADAVNNVIKIGNGMSVEKQKQLAAAISALTAFAK